MSATPAGAPISTSRIWAIRATSRISAETSNWLFFDNVGETVYSQEFNLISPDNQRITWVFGLYGQENDYDWNKPYQFYITVGPRFPDPTPSAANFYQYGSYTFQGKTTNRNLAAFGQVEAKLTDAVSVSLGGRWTTTKSKNDIIFWNYGGAPYRHARHRHQLPVVVHISLTRRRSTGRLTKAIIFMPSWRPATRAAA